ncbi:hypothetical protein AGMMS50262_20770 [Bacteroidia bacterium]|nr:hypothetical protein AGMMS50262_20770 [Bacteroidia bacterium]
MGKSKKYLGRGIHDEKFFKSLNEGNLKKMLDAISYDDTLDVQIRENYLNIYYNGGNIVKVNSENSLDFDMFYFYLGTEPKKKVKSDEKELAELKTKRDDLIAKFKNNDYAGYFDEAKRVMDKWYDNHPKPERMEQHILSLGNRYGESDYTIIDLEYQVSTLSEFCCIYTPKDKEKPKKPKFDIIAVNKDGKLCVIELKKGIGALEGTSGLKEHWDCYRESIGRKPAPFVTEMVKILAQKQEFGLIDKNLKITESIPEFMFAYSYDDKNSRKDQDDKFHIEYKKVKEPIRIIKLEQGTHKLMNE